MSQPDGPSPAYMSRPERPNSLANYDLDNGGRAKKMLDEIGAEIGQRAKRQLFSSDSGPTRNRRIGYGVGSLAVLGSMLGIGRDDEEDRREQY
jgi:hypothetical protein